MQLHAQLKLRASIINPRRKRRDINSDHDQLQVHQKNKNKDKSGRVTIAVLTVTSDRIPDVLRCHARFIGNTTCFELYHFIILRDGGIMSRSHFWCGHCYSRRSLSVARKHWVSFWDRARSEWLVTTDFRCVQKPSHDPGLALGDLLLLCDRRFRLSL